jgi:hypothetical protein
MKIIFIPGSKKIKEMVPCPAPARTVVPDWYKDIMPNKDMPGIKNCIPFLDSLTSGYVQKTWTDIIVENNNGEISIKLVDNDVEMVKERNSSSLPIQDDFYKKEFIWQRPWAIKLPEGYSSIITHPFNQIELPFMTLSAIVDSDKYYHANIGNIPFYIKSNFTGTIPAGTPMFQILPIKREDWQSEELDYSAKFWYDRYIEKNLDKDYNNYKKKFWQRKNY